MSFYLNLYENIKFPLKVSALNLQLNLGTNYDLGSCTWHEQCQLVLMCLFFRLGWFDCFLPHICFSSCRGLPTQSTWISLVYVDF